MIGGITSVARDKIDPGLASRIAGWVNVARWQFGDDVAFVVSAGGQWYAIQACFVLGPWIPVGFRVRCRGVAPGTQAIIPVPHDVDRGRHGRHARCQVPLQRVDHRDVLLHLAIVMIFLSGDVDATVPGDRRGGIGCIGIRRVECELLFDGLGVARRSVYVDNALDFRKHVFSVVPNIRCIVENLLGGSRRTARRADFAIGSDAAVDGPATLGCEGPRIVVHVNTLVEGTTSVVRSR